MDKLPQIAGMSPELVKTCVERLIKTKESEMGRWVRIGMLIDYILDENPDDRILFENPGGQECPSIGQP